MAAIPFAVRSQVVADKIRAALDPAPVAAARNGHILNISSLDPVLADCSCGKWVIRGSAALLKSEVVDRWMGHLPPPPRFLNQYRHCDVEWDDVWPCSCNDRCPVCNKEIEPYRSEELEV